MDNNENPYKKSGIIAFWESCGFFCNKKQDNRNPASPWINIEERLPDTDNGQSLREVLVKTTDNRYNVCVNTQVEYQAEKGHITHWCEIPQ